MKNENYLRELYFIFFRQKKIIFWTTGIIFVLSLIIAFLWPPTYSATGSILIRGKKIEKSPEAIEQVDLRASLVSKEDLASEEEIIVSPDVIGQTIKDLGAAGKYKGGAAENIAEDIYRVQSNLRTQVIPASNVIEVTYLNRDPGFAVTLLGSLMENYVAYRLQVYNPNEAGAFFSEQAGVYEGKLGDKERELIDLVHETGISEPQKELENNLLVKNDLQIQLSTLRNEAIEKGIYVEHLKRALESEEVTLFSFIVNLPINELSNKLQELLVERGKLLRAYNPKSDKIKLVDRQIDDTFKILKREVRSYKEDEETKLRIVNSKIASIEERLEMINAENIALQEQVVRLRRIERDASVYQSSYDVFSKRREESRTVTSENVPSQISIVKKAFPSDGPVFPRKGVVIPFGLLVGFISGCSLGFLRDYFDQTFKKPSDVDKYAGLPVIFSIPFRDTEGR